MIKRRIHKLVERRLKIFPAVALLGPRQVGKTTLAKAIAQKSPSMYLDLEKQGDLAKLGDPHLYLSQHENKLVILDEVQRVPNIFNVLRSLIDEGRARGKKSARFLLLGSASIDLLKQSSESLAGRIAYLEMCPLDLLEVKTNQLNALWFRGGFPDSFLAANDEDSMIWRENFIKTYLERDIPQLGPRIPAETLNRFWTMLAHTQGSVLNSAQLARGLAVDSKTIARYLDLMVDLLLVRRLQPYHANTGKRLVKSPKIYIRDSGILHTLLNLSSNESVMSHPILGGSWEGFVVETLLKVCSYKVKPYFYRTQAGAEVDLVLEMPGGEVWIVAIKRGLSPKLEKGFHESVSTIKPNKSFVVYQGEERYPLAEGVEGISCLELAKILSSF